MLGRRNWLELPGALAGIFGPLNNRATVVDLNGVGSGTAEERIVELLTAGHAELTAKQAAALGGMCERHAMSILKRLHSANTIHVKRWVSARFANGTPAASFVAGDGVDAPKPEGAEARLRTMLEHKHELSAVRAAKLGLMSERTAAVFLARLCEERFCHVIAWAHERYAAGEPGAVYAIGDGVDLMRPAPLEGRERKRRHDQRKKAAATAALMAANAQRMRDASRSHFAIDADDYAPARRILSAGTSRRETGAFRVIPNEHLGPSHDLGRRLRTRKERERSHNHFELMHALFAASAAT